MPGTDTSIRRARSARAIPTRPRGASRRALLAYRVMAFSTATLLIVLVFVGVPLQFLAGRPQLADVVGTLHGFLYIVYVLVAFNLTRRLGVPKWQMALVLLAGTVPFCAFVAERKMSRRFQEALAGTHPASGGPDTGGPADSPARVRAARFRARWLSARAVLFHVELLVVAPGCLLLGWWQATRALAGNELSWVYSVEWPAFALLAIGGWWHLIHEDPAAYAARRARSPEPGPGTPCAGELPAAAGDGPPQDAPVASRIGLVPARTALALAVAVLGELALGMVGALGVLAGPPDRSGGLGVSRDPVYIAYSVLGLLVGLGAVAFVLKVRASTRLARTVAWLGLVGVVLASTGGVLAAEPNLTGFLGASLLVVGSAVAAFGYLTPTFLGASRSPAPLAGTTGE